MRQNGNSRDAQLISGGQRGDDGRDDDVRADEDEDKARKTTSFRVPSSPESIPASVTFELGSVPSAFAWALFRYYFNIICAAKPGFRAPSIVIVLCSL